MKLPKKRSPLQTEIETLCQASLPPLHPRSFVREYYLYLLEHNYAAATAEARLRHLLRFAEWCEGRGIEELHQITIPVIERFQRHLYHYRKENGEPLSFGVQAHVLSHVRSFFRWCCKKRFLSSNPASDIEMPRNETRLPKYVLSVEEVEQIFASIDLGTPEGLRDRAILETLYSTGIRRMEAARLQDLRSGSFARDDPGQAGQGQKGPRGADREARDGLDREVPGGGTPRADCRA